MYGYLTTKLCTQTTNALTVILNLNIYIYSLCRLPITKFCNQIVSVCLNTSITVYYTDIKHYIWKPEIA